MNPKLQQRKKKLLICDRQMLMWRSIWEQTDRPKKPPQQSPEQRRVGEALRSLDAYQSAMFLVDPRWLCDPIHILLSREEQEQHIEKLMLHFKTMLGSLHLKNFYVVLGNVSFFFFFFSF